MKSKIKDCAKVILYWHQNIGIEIATENYFKQDIYYKYRELINDLHEAFLCNEIKPEKIARIQLNDLLNRFSHEKIPKGMIKEFRLETIFKNKEIIRLEDLAKYILEYETEYDQTESVFDFPQGWIDEPSELKPKSVTIQTSGNSNFDPVYHAYYKIFKGIKQYNLGGLDLMVAAHNTAKIYQNEPVQHSDEPSCNENTNVEESTTINNPANFNFQFATGTNTLITNVLKGKIRITRVVVGTCRDWALKDKTE